MGIKINLDIAHMFMGAPGIDEVFDEFVVFSPETIGEDLNAAARNLKMRMSRELHTNVDDIVWTWFPCSWNHMKCMEEFRRILAA